MLFVKCMTCALVNPPPQRRSVDQLRGIEGARVKRLYEVLARQNGVDWKRRRYDPGGMGCSRLT